MVIVRFSFQIVKVLHAPDIPDTRGNHDEPQAKVSERFCQINESESSYEINKRTRASIYKAIAGKTLKNREVDEKNRASRDRA